MTLVDGKKIAQDMLLAIASRVSAMDVPPSLTVITCNPNFETQKYLDLKKDKAMALGISLSVLTLSSDASTKTVIESISESIKSVDGVVVQLPLPVHINTEEVLAAIPPEYDVDAFAYRSGQVDIFPPVVGAIDEISKKYEIDWSGKKVVIFGEGKLVGAPALQYAKNKGAKVDVVTEVTKNTSELTKEADIIILGVGKPNLLTKSMVKEGVVIFDAGASEDGGLLVGDASPDVAVKASWFTPVPGGIGPVTVALLFRNLLELRSRQ